jgi:SpoVK/Ycf46/Vps4 family AAA+-type ATPase
MMFASEKRERAHDPPRSSNRPGTGKTMLVRAAARESECILFCCTSSALTSKWHGEGEKILRTLFAVAVDAAPSIVLFDEIDALLSARRGDGSEHEASRRFKTEFMVQVDGVASATSNEEDGDLGRRVLVLGCSNCPWDIDDAVMRRFQRRIYVPLPDAEARRFLLDKLLSKERGGHSLSERDVQSVVDRTEGFSCSDIAAMAQEAAFGPLRDLGSVSAVQRCDPDDVQKINKRDFDEALASTKRSVSNELLEKYRIWEDQQSVR